jgi:hypothetical protein
MYADKIAVRANAISARDNLGMVPLQPGQNRVCGFLDDNNTATCRPGGGPAAAGPGAPRNPGEMQEAFYSGWLRKCGIKHQTFNLPDGHTGHIFGPASMRHNDLYTLRESDFDNELDSAQNPIYGPLANHYVAYVDSIFPPKRHLRGKHAAAAGHPNKAQLDASDRAFNSCRESVEHDYSHADISFPCLNYSKRLKIRGGMPLKEIYFTKVFFRNCLVSLYGNITSSIYECEPMSLSQYLS